MTSPTHSQSGPSILDRLRVAPQYLLPQHLVTAIIHRLTRSTWEPLKNGLIHTFIFLFRVDMSCSIHEKPADYESFNAFFTRAVKPALRPIATGKHTLCSPIDGTVSQCGAIEANALLQAKKKNYKLADLLANDETAKGFVNGLFCTLYLSPHNYHRVHMPCSGRLRQMTYVPGSLFAVNAHTTRVVNNLFARNERLISLFDTDNGPMALIMVGAMLVGSIETAWENRTGPAGQCGIRIVDYPDRPTLEKGKEMGRFNMGSTVILLYPQNTVQWLDEIQPEKPVIMGQSIGCFVT